MSAIHTDPLNKDDPQNNRKNPLLWALRISFVIAASIMIAANAYALPKNYQLLSDVLSGRFFHPITSFVFADFIEAHVNPENTSLWLDFFAKFYNLPGVLLPSGYLVAGAYIFYRRPTDRMAILTATLLAWIGFTLSPAIVLLVLKPLGDPLLRFLVSVFAALIPLFMLTFPDGRFVPQWTCWLLPFTTLIAMVVWWEVGISMTVGTPLYLLTIGGLGFAPLYRYLRVSSPLQRQQTKWVLLGLCVAFLFIAGNVIYRPFSVQSDETTFFTYELLVFPTLWFGAWLAILATVSFSVLHYRLWQVDLVINRSVVYLALTAVLLALFMAIFLVLQDILGRILGGRQPMLAGIGAAGVVVGVFNPLRRQLQHVIDRGVYRLRADISEIALAQKKPEIKNPGIYTGRIFGRYELQGLLGKGGMGEVYKGVGDGQTAAIKVLPTELALQVEFLRRFTREAQTLAQLEHPNIVKLFGAGVTDDGVHYLAMEFIEGEELSRIIRSGPHSTYEDVEAWLTPIAAALDYIHGKGLVHRDLKPSNIMLRQNGTTEEKEAILMDFGIAHIDASGPRLTGSGAIGTIDYMAPEQILAAREVDKRSDIYALGIIVYEFVTGERPFNGNAGQILFAHLQKPAPDPRNIRPDVPRNIAKAVLRALEKDPDARYATAGEFATALITQEALST